MKIPIIPKKKTAIWSFWSIAALLVVSGASLAGWSGPSGAPAPATGALVPVAWPAIDLVQVSPGLNAPVYLTHAADGSKRIFVVEQAGRIRIIHNGQLQAGPFLDIRDRVRSPASGGGTEEGLLSVAFPPGYAQSGRFYLYYTDRNGDNRLARFQTSGNADLADAGSEQLILHFPHPQHSNHNGGQLVFGPDGNLYISTGDGGGGGDPDENAQDPGSLLGKILRIDVEPPAFTPPGGDNQTFLPFVRRGQAAVDVAYHIPEDNPFAGQPGFREEIWALGLRNPWRFSFDRQTGDMYIADVGQGDYEEVDYQPAGSSGGENYGWDIMEGPECYESTNCDQNGLVLPIFSYRTHVSGSCAVTGGFVYRGQAYPGMQGIYFAADYCNGKIWGLQRDSGAWASQELLDTGHSISSFGEDEDGELYIVDRQGAVYQVVQAAAGG